MNPSEIKPVTVKIQGFPPTFVVGLFHGIGAGYCKECQAIFFRSADAYIHWEYEHRYNSDVLPDKKSK